MLCARKTRGKKELGMRLKEEKKGGCMLFTKGRRTSLAQTPDTWEVIFPKRKKNSQMDSMLFKREAAGKKRILVRGGKKRLKRRETLEKNRVLES